MFGEVLFQFFYVLFFLEEFAFEVFFFFFQALVFLGEVLFDFGAKGEEFLFILFLVAFDDFVGFFVLLLRYSICCLSRACLG